MIMFKLQNKLAVLLFLLTSVFGGATQAQTSAMPLKVLAEGSNSDVEKPFLAVARDVTVYNTLRAAVAPNLENHSADYFETHAIIFAYLGQRRSGGYSVNIVEKGNRFIVLERAPAKGSMTTQALTTPFQVAEITLEHDAALPLAFDTAWHNALTSYKVKQGNFQMSGGFAGITEKFGIKGQIRTWTHGDLVTFVMDLQSVRGKAAHRLQSIATALVPQNTKVNLPYLHADSFVQPPANVLVATGAFDRTRRKLTLKFASLPNSRIADGFEGKGQLIAQR